MSKLAWNKIDWILVQKRISRQQKRVYKASTEGKRTKVHELQRRIIESLDAKLMAIRCVTKVSKVHNTAIMGGGETISCNKKIKLANRLQLDGKTSSIIKLEKAKFRKRKYHFFDISIIEDKAKQMLAKFALEPEWEAIFEINSYGFRPGKSYYDAIASRFFLFDEKPRYFLDINLNKCVDNLNYQKLFKKLATFGQMENQIKAWINADIMLGFINRPDTVFRAIEGKPQGGIISPLLTNIVLNGLEEYIKEWYKIFWHHKYSITRKTDKIVKMERKMTIGFSRYADCFLIAVIEHVDIIAIAKQVKIWLKNEAGLELSKSKMRIVSSTKGFKFLGFDIILLKKKTEIFRIKIYPSKTSKLCIINCIRQIIQENRSISSYFLVSLLAIKTLGWANYFRFSNCIKDCANLDYTIFKQIRVWVFRRKSKGLKSRMKLKQKYFPRGETYCFRGRYYKANWILTGKIQLNSGKQNENFLPKILWGNF